MKRLSVIILMAVVLVAVVTGCGGMRRYDVRLVQADSLMWPAPDSALAIVSALDSLAGDANLAYRDLLLTQARYKCYAEITAGDDSAITRAIAWYRARGGEREKLTRAYLYKGAVMQELGHVDSAMYYYKTAELNADEKDYVNLGQINTRIGDLFRKCHGDEQTCYDKYNQAYHYHQLAGNKKMQLNNLCRMFMMNGITHQNDQDSLLNRALNLANELGDNKKLCFLHELRCRQLSRADSTRQEAKQIALHCLNHYSQYINNDLLMDLAFLYAKENKLDSARFFLDNVDLTLEPDDKTHISIRKNEILSIIAQQEGNPSLSHQYTVTASHLSDSILDNRDKYVVESVENKFNQLNHNHSQSNLSLLQWAIIGLSIVAIAVIVILTAIYLSRLHRTKSIIKNLEKVNTENYEKMLNRLEDKSSVIEQLLSNLIALIRFSTTNNRAQQSASQVAQQIKETIVDVADDDFWSELRAYLDKQHHGIISNLEQAHHLKEKDLRFIELSCCGFSYVVMAIILDYSPHYVLNKRKILANKMGLDVTLQEYLEQLMME